MEAPMAEILVLSAHIRIDFALDGVWRGRRFIPLPARTWAILAYLARHPNTVIANDQLLAVGWPGEPHVPDDLGRHIHRIRQAVEPHPHHPQRVLTYRTVGYCLRIPSTQAPFVS
ncbi:winged helix family transcriptional regulator [Alicyclobacillaceae bacterium I2511]|nr:winged helix family transcriptional regulator [Alicyclobacillaceae bacterium I2511]